MKDLKDAPMFVLVAPDGTPQPNTLCTDEATVVGWLKLMHKKGFGQTPAQLFYKGNKIAPVKVTIAAPPKDPIAHADNPPGGVEMRELASMIKAAIPGLGFALLVFEFDRPGMANYISNAQREDMIKALEETLVRWKSGTDYPTPEKN